MRLRERLAPLVACLAIAGLAGCGSSGPAVKPKVNVSITAPTSGATVGVRKVTIAGTVAPASAQVLVAGEPAQVVRGSFTRSLLIASASQTINVTARASGYDPGTAKTTVEYSPTVASQLVAASSSANANGGGGKVNGLNLLSPTPPAAQTKALNSAFAIPSRTTNTTTRTPSAPSSTSASTSPSTTPTATNPTPPPASTPSPSPSGPPVLTVQAIKQAWEHGCIAHTKGKSLVPYCTCVYNHLRATGAFNSRTTVLTLLKQLNTFARTGKLSAITHKIRTALDTCAAKLPPLKGLGGRPVITKLPGQNHGPVPVPVPTGPSFPR